MSVAFLGAQAATRSIDFLQRAQTAPAKPVAPPTQAPAHVDNLLWKLSTPQERVQLMKAPTAVGQAAPACGPDSGPPDRDQPAAIPTGDPTYYRQRADDFKRRNPCLPVPPYYLEYGDKYANRFDDLNNTDLSPEGLQWRDKTLKALQDAMEDKRRADPVGFAELERNPGAFRQFAYGTHPDAYVNSGLFKLPAQDLAVIAATPNIGDVLTQDGIRQTLITAGKLSPQDALRIGGETIKQTVKDGLPFPFGTPWPGAPWLTPLIAPAPLAPSGYPQKAVVIQGERIIDRILKQDWF